MTWGVGINRQKSVSVAFCEYGLCSKKCIQHGGWPAYNMRIEWIWASNYCYLEDLRKYLYGNQIKFLTMALFTFLEWLPWKSEALCSVSSTIINVTFGKPFKHAKRMFRLAVGMPYALMLPQCDFAKSEIDFWIGIYKTILSLIK